MTHFLIIFPGIFIYCSLFIVLSFLAINTDVQTKPYLLTTGYSAGSDIEDDIGTIPRIMQSIADEAGITIEIKEFPFKRSIHEVIKGKV